MNIFRISLIAAALVVGPAALASVSLPTLGGCLSNWRLEKSAHVEGNLLIVDVPSGGQGGAARCTVDLGRFKSGVEFHVRARGENVSRPPEKWQGTKFMLHYKDASGNDVWPGAAQHSGTFDWCDLRFGQSFGTSVKDGVGELILGLQSATGRIIFDLSTLRAEDRPDLWLVPKEDADYRCPYTAALEQASRRRGVMLPAGPCSEGEFKTLKDWGATLVRYQMCRNWSRENDNRDGAEYDRWLDGKLEHLDQVILPYAAKYGMEVVVDLHVAPGGRAQDDLNMFYDPVYAEQFLNCWRKIAARFKGRRGIYGYDLINEPNQQFAGVADGDYWNLQRRAAEAVRAIDPNVTIILESNGWDSPSTFGYLRPLRMTNVVYQAHMYHPHAFTHQGVGGRPWKPVKYPDPDRGWDKEFLRAHLKPARDFQLQHGARIYIGEFSAVAWAEGADAYLRDCISLFDEYGWDWTYHAFREWSGWSVEHEADSNRKCHPSSDNPRKRALLEGLRP